VNIGIDARYIQDHFPGIGRYAFNLIRALAEVAPQDRFVVFYNPTLPNTRYDVSTLAAYPNLELVHLAIPTFSLAEQHRLPQIIRHLYSNPKSKIQNPKSGVALFHSPYYIKPYFGLPCPSVVTIYDVISARYPEYLPSWRARLGFELTTRLALATSAHVLTLSEASRRDLVTLYRVRPDRVSATLLAADDRFRPQPAVAVAAVRHKYGLLPDYVLYLGINKPHKNLLTLVDAWNVVRGPWSVVSGQRSAVSGQRSAVSLVLAGREDPRYPEVRRRVKELGLEESVRFLGDVAEADLPALYTSATVFVFPSLYEGFGLPVLEAMACGAPVVCSNTSSLPEVAGDAALQVPPTDVAAWVEAISRVLTDDALRRDLAARSLARAARFSWQQTARETLEVYRACRLKVASCV
jgi:alpha-1,3-rhamnosyl/mannosyltransferase